MKLLHANFRSVSGATLPEVLIGAAVASIVLGALMIGSIALQRAFVASNRLANTQADLIRVSDYMARDIRNATSVTPSNGTSILSVTTGDFYDRRGTPNNPTDDVANSPTLGRTGAVYGTNPVVIRYGRSGTRISREVTRVDAGVPNTSVAWIADDVGDLAVAVDANGVATITSGSTMHYSVLQAGAKSPPVSYLMASQPLNRKP